MIPFDAIKCPLNGVNLIEASAGTGKTHALASLYLRFVLERELAPRQILVITYTKAATAELKRRIRKMLQEAQTAFAEGNAANSFLQAVLEQHPDASQRKKITSRLGRALTNFDEAAIHTIHGFCQRILLDNAFESATMFDAELIENQLGLEREFVEDFWRRNFYQNDPLIVRYALSCGINKGYFLQLLKLAMVTPALQVIPDYKNAAAEDLHVPAQELKEKFRSFQKLWQNQRSEIISLLQSSALHAGTYGKKVDKIAGEIDGIALDDNAPLPVPPALIKLSAQALCSKTKKGATTPQHQAFALCDDLCLLAAQLMELLENRLARLKKQFLEELLREFPKMKQKKNVLYFDDLLVQAQNALLSSGGEKLAQVLRKKYRAVLVDEFQDTDPLQFAILQSIFLSNNTRSENVVFYIGDPKQAIYSFRGADIFAYLRASKNIDYKYSMQENWRSESALVNAINVLFATPSRPFVYEEIEYIPVEAAKGAQVDELHIEDEENHALQWWFLPGTDDNKPLGVTDARDLITRAVIAEISRLLELSDRKKVRISDRPLQENDIAVLVRKNVEAISFQKELTKIGIPSVLLSTESVFISEEAEELKRFLLGVISWENEGYLLAALATSFFELAAEDLAGCLEDEAILANWRIKFQQYHDLWRLHGFLTMFYVFLDKEHVRQRLMTFAGGERKLTNYLHLAQELHLAQKQENLNFPEILRWLDDMRSRADTAADEEQLRLETDKNCVKIVTIHKSKGLEYPVVFCPFGWEKGRKNSDAMPLFFHDGKNNWQLTADLGSAMIAANREQYAREILAENCRLLYVALTRAKNCCYFVWGKIKNTADSAAAYLFHRQSLSSGGNWDALRNDEMLGHLNMLVNRASTDIQLKEIGEITPIKIRPAKEGLVNLNFRQFKGSIDHSWKIASFTYLTSMHRPHEEEARWEIEDEDKDYMFLSQPAVENTENMLAFPRGTTTGIMLHEILENLNYAEVNETDLNTIVSEKLSNYRFDQIWLPAVEKMIKELIAMPLGFAGAQFSLNMIPAKSCRKEVEFCFPLQEITAGKIINVLENTGLYRNNIASKEDLYREIYFPLTRGYLKGFIDMVFEHEGRFYLVDWKSNYLGESYAHYVPDSLKNTMSRSSYVLQYLLYTVALVKYLQRRVKNFNYEKHFGGVYYIFLRGLNAEAGKGNGVYFDLPDYALIRQLDRLMLPTDE
ncbi:MAG: exodeoxyribonuclease V subunit beta [Smithella sp.]